MTYASRPPVSALRASMIEDRTGARLHRGDAQAIHSRVTGFAAFIHRHPDTATAEDLRRFPRPDEERSSRLPAHQQLPVTCVRFFFHSDTRTTRPAVLRSCAQPRRLRARLVFGCSSPRFCSRPEPGPSTRRHRYRRRRRAGVSEVVALTSAIRLRAHAVAG